MKTWVFLALVLCCAALRAADSGPADMALSGPDSSRVGESVRLRLDGLPAVDLTKTMSEQLAWLSQVKILTAAPKGVSAGDYTLDQQLSIKVSPFQWTFAIDFAAKKAGDYVVIVDWNEAPFGLVYHRVQVGGGGPGPDPTQPSDPSDPTDPQTPARIDRVTYVWEKDSGPLPRPVSAALQSINAAGSGVVATEFEDDSTDGEGEVPEQYRIALAAARKAGLPAVVYQSGVNVVTVVKDPRTKEAVLEVLK